MTSLQIVAKSLSFSSVVLVGVGCQLSHPACAAGVPNRMLQPAALSAADVGYSAAAAGRAADAEDFVLTEDQATSKGGDPKPAAESSPPSSPGSARVRSSTTGSHSVSGGGFPPQPPKFPPEVNGPGRTVPTGPYRPLPSPPPGSTTKKVPG